MKDTVFISGLAQELQNYLDYKVASGYQESSFIKPLKQFDKFCSDRGIKTVAYTDDEVRRYFKAVDTYNPHGGNKKNLIQLPVLFRLLYCCGTRINETLGIRKRDVDLENGIIALYETKNNCARYIVLSDEMKSLICQYADKCSI